MQIYKSAVIGCSRMGAFIDNEVIGAPGHVPPYAHTAVFTQCTRTDLVACSDIRTEVMEEVGIQFNIPKQNQYTDYKTLIDNEQPDIISVATQPEHRAEIIIYAASHGVKAIYAEKALCASMEEAKKIVEVCEQNRVFLNLGTQRRWHPGFVKMRQVIESGNIGNLKRVVFSGGGLFNTASHYYDNLLYLNGDIPAKWVQMTLVEGDWKIEGNRLTEDPVCHGVIQFENDVTAYAVLSPHEMEWEASCERGTLTVWPGFKFKLRQEGPPGYQKSPTIVSGRFPRYQNYSPNLRLVEDLVNSLDTGNEPQGGVRSAFASTELIFASIQSHINGGARVELPLKDNNIYLHRERKPRHPQFKPN